MKPLTFSRRYQYMFSQQQFSTIITILIIVTAATTCKIYASFVDSSSLKPSIVLILPQSFKVPTSSAISNADQLPKIQQYVAVLNNIHNERDDKIIREQFKKLTLQVRDAKSQITGQLFYEHVFNYFPQSSKQYLLIPIDLEQVSPIHENLAPAPTRSYASALTGLEQSSLTSRPQHLIISIRPHNLDSGFGSESIEFASSAPIPVESVPSSDGRRSFGILQTDKPIYKPKDKVRIRILVINEVLRPVTRDELRLQIKNPHKVIVEEARFPNNETQNSDPLYLDHTFEFPPEPMLGTWTAHLLHNDPVANDTISFEVKEYVLPTYEIEFVSPKYIVPNTQVISGYIEAKYHHGKPVQGKAQFKFGYKESATARPKFIARSSIKTVDPITGRVDFKINSEKFKETEWFPSIAGSRLFVEATVTEASTGHREVAVDSSCIFISTPYRISFEDTIEDFKHGLSQQLTVQVLEMQTNRPAPMGTRLTAHYINQNGTYLDVPSQIANNQTVDFHQVLDTEATSDESGYASFNVGPVREDITSIQATIRWINSTQQPSLNNELAIGHHVLVKHESRNGWISFMNKSITHLNVGDIFVSDLLIRDAVVIPKKVFYTIVARGQIISLDSLNSDDLVKFEITEPMLPSIRVVLFALTHDQVGLLSDSIRINVGQDLSCGLSLSYKSNDATQTGSSTIRPNDKGKLSIQARQGDLVSLIGVDSAIYTLNNRSRLDSSRIIQRIKRLDTGCGFGGGKNNLDVFHNAGLMLFKDVYDSDPDEPRLGSSCLTVQNQLMHIEDIQLGYSRPMFLAAAKQNRPRVIDLASRNRISYSTYRLRTKRETDVESILNRYKDPLERSCCHLGTLEDVPQRRNCSVRSRIVEKYMRHGEHKSCSKIYFDCCRAVFGDYLLLGSVLGARSGLEPIVETRVTPTLYAPQLSEAVVLSNLGHLDRIEMDTLTRKDFRETWLFELVNVDQVDGSASLDTQLPHSITTWAVSAMALNRYQPMCLMSHPLELTVFQEIFLHVSMPYKVIQGEQIDLVATIFNYSPQTQEVQVYMYGVEEVCSEADPGERSDRKRLRLDKHSSQSVIFPMFPLKVGEYTIKILAITSSSSGSDIVERQLNVVPRGKSVTDETTFSLDPLNQQRRSKRAIQTGNLVDEIDSTKGLQRSKIRLTPRESENMVPNTQECIISAIGDRMGQSVQTTMIDVENLIRLPHGCGEQVMIYLGPTLYTTRYLGSINKLTGDLRWRAIRYIQSGYKRILNYRKENGAFSAFPRRDASIWLTAFICKMLCQTERTQFVAEEVHVDRTVINSALNWLIDQQNEETGTWVEMNPVYHREMLGGVLKENALTAFVTIALNECAHHSPDVTDEIEIKDARRENAFGHSQSNEVDKLKLASQLAEKALKLDRYKAVKERNPYVMALTAYALSFSRPNDAVSVLNDLLSIGDRSQSRNQLFWRGDYPIETAAYALQALIELAPVINASPSPSTGSSKSVNVDSVAIANWLSSRRSYTGAFESTQDTVVALEALSKFAQLQLMLPQTAGSSLSLTCNVTVSNRTRRSIEFGKDNAQIQQTFKIDSIDIDSINGELIDVVTSGNGIGTMSIKFKYNVFQEEDELCRFNIESTIDEWQPKISQQSAHAVTPAEFKNDQNDGTIDDDYFRSFDRSMLSELNLMPPKQESGPSLQQQSTQLQVQSSPHRLILMLRVCAQHLSTRRDSEMAVIEVGIISGFKPNEADLKGIIDDPGTPAMKYEISADKSLVIFYMQYIPFSGVYCLEFRLERESLVYNLQSGYVRVYEYYSPAHSCSNFYTPTRVTDLIDTKCDASGQVCSCATKSLCPATKKLLDLGEIYSVNATSARSQLINLICSKQYDFVSLVRLKSVYHLEAGKMFKLYVKVKTDLKGNLTAIMNLQHQQRLHFNSNARKHPYLVTDSSNEDEETSLDYLNVNIDSTCVRNDPFLLHLAHPNQWKQGGELMILFAKHGKLEKRFSRGSAFPRPKSNTISGVTDGSDQELLQLINAQQLQYSLALQLDKDSILHDLTYQAKSEGRERINNLILWLELRSRREKLSCL